MSLHTTQKAYNGAPHRCYLCRRSQESISHLFLHWPVAIDKWSMFYCIFGLNWVMPQNLRDAYLSWSLGQVDKSVKKIWIMIPAIIFWCLWNEINKRCFDGISTPNHSLKAKCLTNLFSWTKLSPVVSTEHFLEFISSLVLD